MEAAHPQEEEHQTLVDTFLGITSSTREEALFFLESHNWEIDPAVLSFFDSATGAVSPASSPTSPSPPPVVAAAAAAGAIAMASSSSSKDRKAKRPAGGIHTLADINRAPHGDGSDSDSDGPPEYYTGGEKSGMLVQDPSKGGGDDHVDAIFDQARQLGAMEGPLDHNRLSSSSRSFTGTGRLLSGETVPAAPQPPQAVIHNIVFWRNGFSVNDGPLRRLDDPENASFLESIKKSECPKELEPSDRRSPVHVNLIRKDENYVEPEKQYSPFQGVARTLGGGSNATNAASIPASAPAPSAGLVVDDSKPSTSIQLRLSDGTRMVARFNLHHTLGDIRAFIDASRPGGYPPYRLQSVGFPPKQLTDLNQTIQEAGLANSVVIQKH